MDVAKTTGLKWQSVILELNGKWWQKLLVTLKQSSLRFFFVMSKFPNALRLVHFSGVMINKMKLITEICVHSNHIWSLQVKEKKIGPVILGLQNTFCSDTFDFVRQLCYCDGVNIVNNEKADYFTEHVMDGNSEKLKYRSKLCDMVLAFKNSNMASTSCLKYKNLEKKTKQHERESADKENICVDVLKQPHNFQENVPNELQIIKIIKHYYYVKETMKICQKCYHLFFPTAVKKLKRFFFLINGSGQKSPW